VINGHKGGNDLRKEREEQRKKRKSREGGRKERN
jgi:hypothetical protein